MDRPHAQCGCGASAVAPDDTTGYAVRVKGHWWIRQHARTTCATCHTPKTDTNATEDCPAMDGNPLRQLGGTPMQAQQVGFTVELSRQTINTTKHDDDHASYVTG